MSTRESFVDDLPELLYRELRSCGWNVYWIEWCISVYNQRAMVYRMIRLSSSPKWSSVVAIASEPFIERACSLTLQTTTVYVVPIKYMCGPVVANIVSRVCQSPWFIRRASRRFASWASQAIISTFDKEPSSLRIEPCYTRHLYTLEIHPDYMDEKNYINRN